MKFNTFINRIRSNSELKKILANINWLVLDKVIGMAVSFIVGVWAVRYLGPEQYGALSYSIAFVGLFAFIARLGMDEITVREYVKYPEKKGEIFGTTLLLRFYGSLVAIIFTLTSVYFVKSGDTQAFLLTLIIAFSFIFQIADVVDLWFQSQVKSKYSVYVRSAVCIIIGLIKIGMILANAPLVAFAVIILVESVLMAIGFVYFFLKKKDRALRIKTDIKLAKAILSDSWPLILASVAVTIYMRIDQIMIGNMLGNESLGIYSVAVTLSEAWYFLPMIISASVFPAIIYSKKISQELYLKRLQMLYDGMVWLALTIAIVITVFSAPIISFLFGQEFIEAAKVLSVYVWAGIFVFVGVANSKYWIAENLTKISLIVTASGAVMNVGLNLWLIPTHGILGAAYATLISYAVSGTIVILLFKKARILIWMQIRSLNLLRFIKYLR